MISNGVSTGRIAPYSTDGRTGKSVSNDLPNVHTHNRELFRLKSSRFVALFPDELIIQEKTVSVIRRGLFMSAVETLPIKDIGRVVYVDAPFFAGLQILGKNPSHDLHIKGLNKGEAMHAKEVIEGLLLEDEAVVEMPVYLRGDQLEDPLEKPKQVA
jgi:hypothetical protein